MPSRRPQPLTATQLREINQRCGKEPVVRLLLWEIARLRGVIKVLYRQIVRLTPYSGDTIQVPLDEAVEEAMEEEPAILEEQRQDAPTSAASMPRRRWPHMSEEAEERLQRGGTPEQSDRDLKRKSRQAR
jgi:hypothetical protein